MNHGLHGWIQGNGHKRHKKLKKYLIPILCLLRLLWPSLHASSAERLAVHRHAEVTVAGDFQAEGLAAEGQAG